ncbi:eight transmembrane protein EpsH [Desulfobulbus propionicus DSM 2032]|uniref:Eight transmembrane protein EpsH n=1 Tax=Desulfobulbus propionicus (strain ATCC 33891 / DSM 2032 / VKM B-1956 / 1pr3) TaxID=577650 RepID=A0A7U4DN29_DESPD|nr:exosortase/archaeosortase family protein [Desulfobulbus propionicus]ADW16512.1 eight transmembrane protein EpsH [Desulfobulbus propionicus DSM 2032]
MHAISSLFRANSTFLLLFLVVAALAGLYFPVLTSLANDWSTNDNYSHGFFIPLISGYMVYSMKEELSQLSILPTNWGLPFLVAGLGQLYIARVGSEYFLQRTSLILVLLGITLFLLGKAITKKVLLPIAYLLFMVPLPAIIWNKIAFPMQLFSSAITEEVVRMIGIPIFREGNVLHLAQTTLEVVDACSGLRSLTTMFALAAALAWFTDFVQWKKWVLFFLAAPVAMFANIVRLTATAGLASIYGGKVAQGFLHDFSGIFTFVLGLSLLMLSNKFLLRKK